MSDVFSSKAPVPVKFRKKTFKFRENYGYRPNIYLYVQRLKGKKEFPRFDFKASYISEDSFCFYHEPYDKKEFLFCWQVYEAEPERMLEYHDDLCVAVVGEQIEKI